jgi:3-methyladenine DNA glycosylase AlkC
MAINLYPENVITEIKSEIIDNIKTGNFELVVKNIDEIINQIHASIPDKKRISYGIHSVIKSLGKEIFKLLSLEKVNIPDSLFPIYDYDCKSDINFDRVRALILKILASWAANSSVENMQIVLPYFEKAGGGDDWELREHCSGFLRDITKAHKAFMQDYLIRLTKSENENVRRLVSESNRPVAVNKWVLKEPEYLFKILRNLFTEPKPYPRTSVGNNLSDWARTYPEMVYEIVEELVKSGDKNSYWVAYRACRNLVKEDPIRVMDILKVDEYKYKNRIHRRSESN